MNLFVETLGGWSHTWWFYLLNAAWQASLLAVIALLVVSLLRKLPSPFRYWLLVIALIKFAMPPLSSLPR